MSLSHTADRSHSTSNILLQSQTDSSVIPLKASLRFASQDYIQGDTLTILSIHRF